MVKLDFITLSNIIFKDKKKYKKVSDEEKELNFFILNRKFAFKYLKQAQFFNNKNIDKASALDVWYEIFYRTTNGTPKWWWQTKPIKKVEKSFNSSDIKLIKDYYNLTNKDMNFLINYYSDKMKDDIKRIKRFKK